MGDEKSYLLNCDSDYVKSALYNSIDEYIDIEVDFHNHDRRYLVSSQVLYAKIITVDNNIYDNIVSFHFTNHGIKIEYKVDKEDFSDDFYLKDALVEEKSIKYISYDIREKKSSSDT